MYDESTNERKGLGLALPGAGGRNGVVWGITIAWFLAALAVRTVGLDGLPPGDWYDEAINGLDALDVMADVRDGRAPAIFFTTEDHPREPLFIYATAATFSAVGVSTWSLRWTAAWIGALTVAAFWIVLNAERSYPSLTRRSRQARTAS